jgi:hypothetical protein
MFVRMYSFTDVHCSPYYLVAKHAVVMQMLLKHAAVHNVVLSASGASRVQRRVFNSNNNIGITLNILYIYNF